MTPSPVPTSIAEEAGKPTEREVQAKEMAFKPGDKPEDLLSVRRGAIRAASPDTSIISIEDANNVRLEGNTYHSTGQYGQMSVASPSTLRGRLQWFWVKNKGLAFVLIAQFFGALMNVATRMLEMDGNDGKPWKRPSVLLSTLTSPQRQRLPSLPSFVCQDEHNCPMLVHVYVAHQDRALSPGSSRSPVSACCARAHWLLWHIRNVL